ncbi:hypothetical protein GCM10027446_02970 [Angustibacter peucedani]
MAELVRRSFHHALGPAWRAPSPTALQRAVGGRVVLVTGASSGIGEATARLLGAAGATVLVTARRAEVLVPLAAEVGGQAYPADLREIAEVDRLVDDVLRDHGRVDVLVCNAGRSMRRPLRRGLERFDDVQRAQATNYTGPVRLLTGLLPSMRERGGHVVVSSTASVDLPTPQWSAYTASKAALEAWIDCAAAEMRRDGVRTTSVHWPLVHTPMSAPTYPAWVPGLSAEQAAQVVAGVLVRRPRRLVPWWARAAGVVPRTAPGLYDAVAARVVRR